MNSKSTGWIRCGIYIEQKVVGIRVTYLCMEISRERCCLAMFRESTLTVINKGTNSGMWGGRWTPLGCGCFEGPLWAVGITRDHSGTWVLRGNTLGFGHNEGTLWPLGYPGETMRRCKI